MKKQAKVTAIQGMDFKMDEEVQLVVGFDDGTLEVRKHRQGTLVHTVSMTGATPIHKLAYYDYRNNGTCQLIAIGKNGQIQGYTPAVESVK